MNQSEALEIAERQVDSFRNPATGDVVINDEITERHEAGYVFFYNTREFWETRDPMKALAGNGPILVKDSGEVVVLPTNRSIESSLQAF